MCAETCAPNSISLVIKLNEMLAMVLYHCRSHVFEEKPLANEQLQILGSYVDISDSVVAHAGMRVHNITVMKNFRVSRCRVCIDA